MKSTMLSATLAVCVLFLCINDITTVRHTEKKFTDQEKDLFQRRVSADSFNWRELPDWENLHLEFKTKHEAREDGFLTERTACDLIFWNNENDKMPGELMLRLLVGVRFANMGPSGNVDHTIMEIFNSGTFFLPV